jgi:hypothetical protein
MVSQVQGPALCGSRTLGTVQPRVCVKQPEGVLHAEALQKRLPAQLDLSAGHAGARGPQPDRLGVAVSRQVINLDSNQRAVDHKRFAAVVESGPRAYRQAQRNIDSGGQTYAVDETTTTTER